VDGQTIEQFEADLKSNLYKIWNRMSSGTYFPPPVRAVSIPKKAGGQRILGVPTAADRVFHLDSTPNDDYRTSGVFHLLAPSPIASLWPVLYFASTNSRRPDSRTAQMRD
jgi:hypothetical protein